MSIKNEYYCPECGILWDLEVCDCGCVSSELISIPEKLRKRDGDFTPVYNNSRTKKKGEGEVNG